MGAPLMRTDQACQKQIARSKAKFAPRKFLRGFGNGPNYFHMSAYEPEPDRVWDEYEWERFLQQQDHKTEKYMELLEKYLDHPQRDQIIAREMGWTQLLNSEDWSEEVDAMLDYESGDDEYASADEQ